MVAAFFVQVFQSALIIQARLKIGRATDKRVGLVNKLILGIQTVKNYVWEQPIVKLIEKARKIECRRYLKLYCLKGLSDGFIRNFSLVLSIPAVIIPLQ